jgi:membrane protein DedA with SNARE-associated domain
LQQPNPVLRFHEHLQQILGAYGYWAIAFIVGLESMGIPLPGETILVLAAIYSAADPTLNIGVVIAVTAIGSILGDNAGYWIGKHYAFPILVRFGSHIGMTAARIKVGQYLFHAHGGNSLAVSLLFSASSLPSSPA